MTEDTGQIPIRRLAISAIVLAGCVLPAGCNLPSPGTTRVLGDVDYASAFAAATKTMGRHFSILSADPNTGEITCRPKKVQVKGERLLGGSPARQIATLHLRRDNGMVRAQVSVELQREGSAIRSTAGSYQENYDEVPNQTPAEDTAATTAKQNETWQTDRYDHAMERKVLDEIYKALHPQADQ